MVRNCPLHSCNKNCINLCCTRSTIFSYKKKIKKKNYNFLCASLAHSDSSSAKHDSSKVLRVTTNFDTILIVSTKIITSHGFLGRNFFSFIFTIVFSFLFFFLIDYWNFLQLSFVMSLTEDKNF